MRTTLLLAAALGLAARAASAQDDGRWRRVEYVLTVDSADLTGFDVTVRVHGGPDTLRLAMAAHPEYDDRFWRYVRGLRVDTAGPVSVTREDSAVWRVVAPPGAPIRYRIVLPPAEPGARGSWRPFLSPTGGLVGGPHSFMYVIGRETVQHRLTIHLPRGWTAAAGLPRGSIPFTYSTRGFAAMADEPLLVGRLRMAAFVVDGARHTVAYWQGPETPRVGGVPLLPGIQALVLEARAVFGRLPYPRFAFLMQDGAYGGLEHASSVTIGAPAQALADDPSDIYLDVAHEYFHAWNLVRLRPAGWGGLSHLPPGHTRELWWSEGVTMYFAEQMLRRAGLPGGRQPRLESLRHDLETYLDNPGHARISPERASWTADGPPGANGDYQADHYLQGKLIATALDLAIRDSTGGRRGMDDVMREMFARHAGPAGFTGADVERTASAVCRCSLRGFFDRHVRGAELLDLAPLLGTLGLRMTPRSETAADSAGRPLADLRVWAYVAEREAAPRFVITDPRSAWASAGLHTGDRITSLNGAPIPDMRAFRGVVGRRGGAARTALVHLAPYSVTRIRIDEIPSATPRQRERRARWLAGR
jgi:predicted metalloprotease with PDZ domain